MAHHCTNKRAGHKQCAEHMLSKQEIRIRFRRQLRDVIGIDQLQSWHELMLSSMLPGDTILPLDDRPHGYIERITKGGAKA